MTDKKYSDKAEKLYPLDNPRKNMFHDNGGQRSRQAAFIKGANFATLLIIELVNDYWKFDDNQQPKSSWHDKQDLIQQIKKLYKNEKQV